MKVYLRKKPIYSSYNYSICCKESSLPCDWNKEIGIQVGKSLNLSRDEIDIIRKINKPTLLCLTVNEKPYSYGFDGKANTYIMVLVIISDKKDDKSTRLNELKTLLKNIINR